MGERFQRKHFLCRTGSVGGVSGYQWIPLKVIMETWGEPERVLEKKTCNVIGGEKIDKGHVRSLERYQDGKATEGKTLTSLAATLGKTTQVSLRKKDIGFRTVELG